MVRALLVFAAVCALGVIVAPAQPAIPSEPPAVIAQLGAGYVFPVFGNWSYADAFAGGVRPGIDIAGSLGQPVVACTDGAIFGLGWNRADGNHLSLRDGQGNQFVYADLSAFSTLASNGAQVKAGQVIGFLGDTGSAGIAAAHVHFEVHPVSGLFLGAAGAIDPAPVLQRFRHERSLPFPFSAGLAAAIPGAGRIPEPGALLLGSTDISTADGLDPGSVRAALASRTPSVLMQTLVPTLRP
jgi:hypothetical protein